MPELSDVLSGGEIVSYKKAGVNPGNDLLSKDEIDALYPDPVHFAGSSNSTINVSTDANVPSFFPLDDFFDAEQCDLFDALTGAVRNISGRTISVMTGTVSFTPEKDGAGTAVFNLVSERSNDGGLTWTPNSNSLRTFELKKDQNQFSTKLSMLFDWLPNEIVRFKAYASDTFSLVSPTETIDGDLYTGVSFFWSLVEVD